MAQKGNKELLDQESKPPNTLNYDVKNMGETLYLIISEVNEQRLMDAIDEMNCGVYYNHDLINL